MFVCVYINSQRVCLLPMVLLLLLLADGSSTWSLRVNGWPLVWTIRVYNVFGRGTKGIEWIGIAKATALGGSAGNPLPVCRLCARMIEQSWRQSCRFARRTPRSNKQPLKFSMIQESCFRLEAKQKMGRREAGRETTNLENDLSDRSPSAPLRE